MRSNRARHARFRNVFRDPCTGCELHLGELELLSDGAGARKHQPVNSSCYAPNSSATSFSWPMNSRTLLNPRPFSETCSATLEALPRAAWTEPGRSPFARRNRIRCTADRLLRTRHRNRWLRDCYPTSLCPGTPAARWCSRAHGQMDGLLRHRAWRPGEHRMSHLVPFQAAELWCTLPQHSFGPVMLV